MAGHSHWAGIKHRKAAADAKKGKVFSKHAKAIMVAARLGGSDPDANLTLKYAIDRARADNMTRDGIERAIKKGAGELDANAFSELTYEGFAPEKVAVVLDILTDNRNRTASELRTLFEKKGGVLGSPGSVLWMFETRGILEVPAQAITENELMEVALEAGADDVRSGGEGFRVITNPSAFGGVRRLFQERGITTTVAEIMREPSTTVLLSTREAAQRVLDFVTELEDHEDVQRVSANFDVPDEILKSLDSG